MGTAEVEDGAARLRPLAWMTLAVAVLLVAGGIVLLTLVEATGEYESSSTLLIDQPRALSVADDSGLIDKLSRLRFKYSGLVTTARFAELVAPEVGLPEEEVRESLFSRVDTESLLVEVGARGPDPDRTRVLADAAAEALVDYVEQEQEEADVPDPLRFFFSIVTPADEGEPLPDPADRYGAAAIVAGVLLLIGAAVALVVLPRRD